jgi:hypothetical protein
MLTFNILFIIIPILPVKWFREIGSQVPGTGKERSSEYGTSTHVRLVSREIEVGCPIIRIN